MIFLMLFDCFWVFLSAADDRQLRVLRWRTQALGGAFQVSIELKLGMLIRSCRSFKGNDSGCQALKGLAALRPSQKPSNLESK